MNPFSPLRREREFFLASDKPFITAFLDHETARIDALIALKERQLELLAEKRAAMITETVTRGIDPSAPMKASSIDWLELIPEGWRAAKLVYLFQASSGSTPRKDHEDYWQGTVRNWSRGVASGRSVSLTMVA